MPRTMRGGYGPPILGTSSRPFPPGGLHAAGVSRTVCACATSPRWARVSPPGVRPTCVSLSYVVHCAWHKTRGVSLPMCAMLTPAHSTITCAHVWGSFVSFLHVALSVCVSSRWDDGPASPRRLPRSCRSRPRRLARLCSGRGERRGPQLDVHRGTASSSRLQRHREARDANDGLPWRCAARPPNSTLCPMSTSGLVQRARSLYDTRCFFRTA